jgi:hypothetical protein
MDIDIDVFSRTFRSSDGYGRGTGMRPSDSLLNDWIIGGRRRKNQKSASKKLDGFAVRTNSVVPILSLGPWTVVTSPSPNYLSSVKKHPAGPPPSESSCMTVAAGNVEGCPSLILSAGRAGPRLAKCFHPRQWQMRPSSGRLFWSHRPKSKKWPTGLSSSLLKWSKMVINWGPIPCSSNPHHISHVRWLWIPKCCWLYRYYMILSILSPRFVGVPHGKALAITMQFLGPKKCCWNLWHPITISGQKEGSSESDS